MSLFRESLRVALLASSIVGASRAGVIVVDPQGNPGQPLLDAALVAAADGDIILLKAGNYLPTTWVPVMQVAGKGVTIVNDAGAPLQTTGFAVTGVPAGSTFALRGLQVFGNGPTFPAVAADQCAGTIWIEDCTVTGATGGWNIFPPADPGGLAITAHQVGGLVIARSTVRGGKGGYNPSPHYVAAGGNAMEAQSTAVAIYGSSVRGGNSGVYSTGSAGGTPNGGHGLVASSGSNVLVTGSALSGGDTLEDASLPILWKPGSGLVVTGAAVRLRDTAVTAGTSVSGQTAPAIDDPGGTVTTSATPARWIEISSPVRSGQLATYRVHGLVNDPVLVFIGSPAAPVAHVGYEGSFVFALSAFIGPVVFGTIPAGGVLAGSALAPPLPAGIDGAEVVLQAAIASTATLESATLYVQVGPNF